MAVRDGILRRFFSTSVFSPQSPAVLAASSTGAGAGTSANSAPVPSTSLFVSGLNKRTTSEKLREAFSKFGEVAYARVVTDRVSGYSKVFGFVRYATIEEAEQGIKGMDGQFLNGWVLFAKYARPRNTPEQASSPGSYLAPN